MATLFTVFNPLTVTGAPIAQQYNVSYTPPANVSGKLCRLAVDEFLVANTDVTDFIVYTLGADLSQPFGTDILVADGICLNAKNTALCATYCNVPYNPSTRTILVQLPDGPMNIVFTLIAGGGAVTDATNLTPLVHLKLTLTPVDKNNHFEKLESYSTGPFVRM